MAKYRVDTDQGSYIVETQDPPAQQPMDPLEEALNYHTGNNYIDAPLGVLQGAAKGVMSTAIAGGSLIRGALGMPQIPQEDRDLVTKPNGIGQGTGKFIEQGAEFITPARTAGAVTEGANVLARAGAQGLAAAGVAGLQSGGNKAAMATGAALGAGGELAGSAISGIRELAGNRAPTLQNFADSFAATPTQKQVLTKALPTLIKDGVNPASSVPEMQGAVKSELGRLSDAYEALPADVGSRELDAQRVIDGLKREQRKYTRGAEAVTTQAPTGVLDANGKPITSTVTTSRPVVSHANQQYVTQLQNEIDDIQKLASARGGSVTFDDLKYMRDGANGRTNFNSPEADQNLYRAIGNVYRGAMDEVAPETTQLNRDWSTYRQLERVIDKNADSGRGTTESAMDRQVKKIEDAGVGAGIGMSLGRATGIPGASWIGGVIGASGYPKLARTTIAALKNAADNGRLAGMSPTTQKILDAAARIGDNTAVLRMLGQSAGLETATKRVSRD